jgi:signal transduction histidine kinase
VDVLVGYSPSGVRLEIADNGIGFEMGEAKPTSLGLRIMRERAEAIRADLHIHSRPGQGTCVTAAWAEENEMT